MAGRYKAYSEYKDSGIEWVGCIPQNWSMWKLTHAFQEIGSGTTPPTDNEDLFLGDIPWITTGELREKLIIDTKKKLSESALKAFPTLRKYPVGSIAIAMYGATIGRLGILGVEATTNQACCVMTTSKQLNNRYLFYWLLAFKEDIISLSSGGGQPNINQEKVASLRVSAPELKEQQKIVNFLDYETAKIDTLIAKQEKLIELLKEKRQAVISHAVTKGLNPDVPMKDSGVEWLGKVPEHWNVSGLSYVLDAIGDVDHYMPPSEDMGVPYVMTGDLKERASEICFDDCKQVSQNDYIKLSKRIKTSIGDVIMARYATIGTVSYVDLEKEFLVSYSCVTIKPNISKVLGLYLFYYFKSQAFLQGVQSHINTNTQGNVGVNDLKTIAIPLPTLDEQQLIVSYLESTIDKIDHLSKRASDAIELMKERKTALISAAVTGKIDVRHFVSEQGQPKGV